MHKSAESTLLDYLRRMVPPAGPGMVSDGELLGRFNATGDEDAFRHLVRRHGPMVLGVARRVLRNGHAAEDVFQATFLVLVRQANSLRSETLIGGWLYRVTVRIALRARPRIKSDIPVAKSAPDAASVAEQNELRAVLDAAVERLPAKLRRTIVLCYFSGHTTDEAARLLDCPKGTVHSRLSAGRDKLRSDLTRRGITISAAALTATLASEAKAAAIPAELLALTMRIIGPTAAITPAVLTLAKGTIAMSWMKVTAATALTVTTAVGISVALAGLTPTPATHAETQEKSPAPAVQVAKSDEKLSAEDRMQVLEWLRDAVKDADAGKDNLRCRTLAAIAIVQKQLGESEESKKTFQKAREVVSGATELRELASAFARAGAVEQALAIVEIMRKDVDPTSVPGGISSNMVLGECASALAVAELEKEALKVADLITDEKEKAWLVPMAQRQYAVALAHSGKMSAALEAVDRIKTPLEQVMALTGPIYFNYAFVDYPQETGIAILQAKAGNKPLAEATLRRAQKLAITLEKEQRNRAIGAIACVYARLGKLEESASLLPDLTKPWRDLATGAHIKALAIAGKNDEARAVLDRIQDDATIIHALLHLGSGQAQSGNRDGARESFERANKKVQSLKADRSFHEHNLIAAQAWAGDIDGAVKTFDESLGSMAIINIVDAVAQRGDYDRALRLADRLSGRDQWWKGNCLRHIAKLQVKNGKVEDALAWIKQLNSPDERAHALLGAAEGRVNKSGVKN